MPASRTLTFPYSLRTSLLALAAAAGLASPALGQRLGQLEAEEDIIREGTSDRREELDEMELVPFPFEHWDLVKDWRLGDGPTLESTDGQVVLIVTFAGWYPPSMRSLGVISRMAEERAEEGLLVFGVHDMEAWDEGVAAAEEREVSFAVGHDAENKFREALLVDQDPDFYLIDRAGQLRFADIETSSVEAAVELLLAEEREEAATLVDRIADAQLRAQIEARRTRLINQEADLREIPSVAFVMPSPEVFAAQRWPQMPRDPNNPQGQHGEQPVQTLALPRDGWHPEAPAPNNGRATVVYFYDPRVPRTTAMFSDMDAIQRRYSRSLQVVGAMTPILQDQGQGTTPAFPQNAADTVPMLRRTREERGLAHALVVDPSGAILGAVSGSQGFQNSGRDAPVTLAAVVSSDGVVRWFGNARSPGFESAVDTVARVDPGVRARRQAEDEYIRRNPR